MVRKTTARNDQAALQRAALDGAGRAWGAVRHLYSPTVVGLVDDVAGGGGISLRDLALIELAELFTLKEDYAAQVDPGERFLERVRSLELQSRKNLRTIVDSMGEGGDVDTRPVRVPDGLRVLPPPDEGDELL